MKVCLITLADRGGMIHYSMSLANELSKNYDISVLIPDTATLESFYSDKINIVRVKMPKKYFSLKSFNSLSLLKILNQINPDLVHITANNPWLLPILPVIRHKYPLVITLHDVKMHLGEWNLLWVFSSWALIKFSKKLFVHGNWAKEKLEEIGIASKKISVINMGLFSSFKDKYREVSPEEFDILFFGRIEKYKGLEYLIKAEKNIKAEINHLKIAIAGSGDLSYYSPYIETSNSFEIHNYFIPDEEVASFFQNTKIVVLPYVECTQTGIIPIAYAFKKAVVVTDVGCIPEMVKDGVTGLIVSPKNVDALSEAIIKLLKDETIRKELGENGYNLMKKDFSWDKIVDEVMRTYEDVLE